METQRSYRAHIARPQAVRDHIYTWFLAFSSWPRLLIEVFTRRVFGERYFSFSSAVMLAATLAYYPFLKTGLRLIMRRGHHEDINLGSILVQNLALYAYLAAFLYMAIQRRREIKRMAGSFDLARYSLSAGLIDKRFLDLKINGRPATMRTIQTLLEPGLFFSIGFVLWLIGQSLGTVLMVSALIYAMSYRAMYRIGDNYVLDKIDSMIVNRQMGNAFVAGLDPSQTQGFQFFGHRPADPTFRRELAARMVDKEEAVEAV